MSILFVVLMIVFAVFKSGTVRFLNADSLSRILKFIAAVVKGELEITMLPEMIGQEVRFDLTQSNLICFFLLVIGICVLFLVTKKIVRYLRSDKYIRRRNDKARRVKGEYRKFKHMNKRVGFMLKKCFFRLYVYVSIGIFPADEFQYDVSITAVYNKKRYYGGIKAGTGRQPMLRLDRVVFCGTDAVQFKFPERAFVVASKKDGAVLHFQRDVETNAGITHRVRLNRGGSKTIRLKNGMMVRFSVSRFASNREYEEEDALNFGNIASCNFDLKEGF